MVPFHQFYEVIQHLASDHIKIMVTSQQPPPEPLPHLHLSHIKLCPTPLSFFYYFVLKLNLIYTSLQMPSIPSYKVLSQEDKRWIQTHYTHCYVHALNHTTGPQRVWLQSREHCIYNYCIAANCVVPPPLLAEVMWKSPVTQYPT